MAVSGISLLITLGIYVAIAVVVFVAFTILRDTKLTRRFFAPKTYTPGIEHPPKIRGGLGAWVPQVIRMSEAEVIRCAGIDAALYIKILRMGLEMFLIISFLVLAIILPINCTGSEVNSLMSDPNNGNSNLAENPLAWFAQPSPPPPPGTPAAPEEKSGDDPASNIVTVPDFYDTDIPPAPPGMTWWKYKDDVPPLPTPEEALNNASYARYGWRWDASYQEIKYEFTDLDKTTMSNISSRSPSLWAHAVVTWVVSLIMYFWLWKYNKEALRLRIFYLLNQPPGAMSHTVLVQDIPAIAYGTIPHRADGTLLKLIPKSIKDKAFQQTAMLTKRVKSGVKSAGSAAVGTTGVTKLAGDSAEADADNAAAAQALSSSLVKIDATTGRWEMRDEWAAAVNEIDSTGTVAAMVEQEFRRIYGDTLSHVHMCHKTDKLDPLVAEYERTHQAATDLLDNYISLKRRGKEMKPKKVTVIGAKMGEWGKTKYGLKPKKVEALEFYCDRLTELRRLVLAEQEAARSPDNLYPSAFVTFKRRVSQVVASRTMMSEDLSTWSVQPAPGAEELVWGNLGWRSWERTGRVIAMWALFWVMAAFFMIPVTAVQGIISANSFLDFLNDIPIAGAMITGILPGLALKIFLAIVPIILAIMNKFAGAVSVAQIDLGVVYEFFIFQVITVFLGSFIAGTFANQLDQFINDPGSIITIFGTSAPQTAIFFLTYLLLAALPQASLNLLRLVPLIIFWVKSKFLAGTERAKARLWQDQKLTYGTLIPNDTIAILLGMTFCVVCPIIAPVAVIYFAHNYVVWKYQHVYVYKGAYQSGGMAWTRVFDQCMTGLVCFHLMMVALLGIKEMVVPSILCAILWLFDVTVWVTVHKRFYRPHECLSLISAADIDNREAAALGAATEFSAGKSAASVDEEVDRRYISPSFKFDEPAHEQVLSEAARMQAVLAGGEDEKLFAEPSQELEYNDDIESGRVTASRVDESSPALAGEPAPAGSASAQELQLEVPDREKSATSPIAKA
ncbi:ERD4-related membrane isoform B [Micractinium conductrix]|uniref:ERD4-related membrane isoform B n=1 Tax=Micractinium conductrix TaxID=554055 RepID=A0A2P6VIQ2_9CHLO|nr:ERD4-related membrane isoform B [Micractinium conductrix]|eukprot:PSC73975.1 ERD4-related membrane isoform B [Micractinium conductrix]